MLPHKIITKYTKFPEVAHCPHEGCCHMRRVHCHRDNRAASPQMQDSEESSLRTGVVKEGLADMTPEWPGSQQAS